ncbi:hypothetical protein ACFP81_08925 [Deinococcus lacus]|uniref:Uncharacterized protein n=1 Tax=Deinococcus lacus TaxID=392561 RepID=A0ABW1YFR7_9DEIO
MLTLQAGGSVLVLAPDHSVLAQAWAALSGLASGCGTGAVLFSGSLTPEARLCAWEQVRSGAARFAAGSYLALTLPLTPRLIVLLEDASDAYKLLSGSRAWIPDLAARVAKETGAALGCVASVPSDETLDWPAVDLPPTRAVAYGGLLGPGSGCRTWPTKQPPPQVRRRRVSAQP